MFTYRLGSIGVASTALYSVDRSLFRFAAKGATDRALARLHATIALDERGRPVEAGQDRRPRPAGAPAQADRQPLNVRLDDRRAHPERGSAAVDDTAIQGTATFPGGTVDPGEEGARPTALLPMTQLLRISAYWLGLTAIDAAVGLFITNRLEFDKLVPTGTWARRCS